MCASSTRPTVLTQNVGIDFTKKKKRSMLVSQISILTYISRINEPIPSMFWTFPNAFFIKDSI